MGGTRFGARRGPGLKTDGENTGRRRTKKRGLKTGGGRKGKWEDSGGFKKGKTVLDARSPGFAEVKCLGTGGH